MHTRLVIAASLLLLPLLGLASAATSADARHPKTPARRGIASPTISLGGERFPAPAPNAPRVLLIGDSNFFGPLGHTLRKTFMQAGYVAKLRGKPSSGLARPEFFDWFAEAERLIDEAHPDLVIVMLGANDVQRVTWPHLGDRIQWRDEEPWRRAYRGRYRAFARFLAERVPEVVMLSPTNRGWDSARAAVTRVREEQQRAVRGLANVHWIDMFPLSSNADGSWLCDGAEAGSGQGGTGKRVFYRRSDRIHLTKAGGKLVGERVIARLSQLALRVAIHR
jgi:hypothetical protein